MGLLQTAAAVTAVQCSKGPKAGLERSQCAKYIILKRPLITLPLSFQQIVEHIHILPQLQEVPKPSQGPVWHFTMQ